MEQQSLNAELKAFCLKERDRIRNRHQFGIGGQEIVLEYTCLADSVVKRIYRSTLEEGILLARTPVVILAVGGYGREDLNLYSDIDIMIVYDDKKIKLEYIELFATKVITALWDIGFDVGHSCRSIKDCVQVTSEDIFSRTSMIEARYIVGARTVYQKFKKQISKNVFKKQVKTFINKKIEEWEDRHQAYGSTIYLQEPNLKESVGGLRDFHTAVWLTSVSYGINKIDQLWKHGVISEAFYRRCTESIDFLLHLRNELHYISGRKNDKLNFELQEKASKNLGYKDKACTLAEESLMRDYYLHAEHIYEFAKLIIDQTRHRAYSLTHWLIHQWQKSIGDGFVIKNGEIAFQKGYSDFKGHDLSRLMKLFAYRQQVHGTIKNQFPISANVRNVIATSLDLIDDDFRHSPTVAESFMSILRYPKNVAVTLRRMHRWQVLDHYIPEFATIRSLVKFDYFHQYTVDEHTLYAIENLEEETLKDIENGQIFIDIMQEIEKPEILRLAILLHDVGKGVQNYGNHDPYSVKMSVDVLERLGLEQEDQDLVLFLVGNHLHMSHIAQQRDLDDIKVIQNFADLVGNESQLKMLYLLTFADIRAVSPSIWNSWNAILLQDLYVRTLEFLRGETGEFRITKLKKDVIDLIGQEINMESIEQHFMQMPRHELIFYKPEFIVKQIRLIEKLEDNPFVLTCFEEGDNYAQLGICAHIERGDFRKVAGVLVSENINTMSASVNTRKDGYAIYVFTINEIDLNQGQNTETPIMTPKRREKIEETLTAVWQNEKLIEEIVGEPNTPKSQMRAQPSSEHPEIRFDNIESDQETIIDIRAKDRLGLLYAISTVLYELGLNVSLAKVTTQAMMAIDSFYVSDQNGKKIRDGVMMEEIQQKLKEKLTG
ncbi:TPA: [protein-PII] uridylyltransferase [Candidatus Poribacteria bacterium]|nr:[protein-PII] uridylyltransferase [Candidatus Poribacteria bacterium]